jgi:hypothetical protein
LRGAPRRIRSVAITAKCLADTKQDLPCGILCRLFQQKATQLVDAAKAETHNSVLLGRIATRVQLQQLKKKKLDGQNFFEAPVKPRRG